MTEEQLQRAYEKQNELLDSLQKDHKALRHLVDKLCQKIEDSPAPRSNHKAVRPYPEDDERDYEPERPRHTPDSRVYDEAPPKESYYKHPAAPRGRSRTPQPEPRQPWNEGPYRNPRDARDSLSPAPRRKMPFDVDKTHGKTEWDMKEPYLKQYNRISDSPGKPATSKYTSPREPAAVSPARRAPRSGDEFCGLCDVYVDKDRFRRDRDAADASRYEPRSPRRDSVDDKPVTYYVQGKILGKVDRPAYIRDLFKPSYVS